MKLTIRILFTALFAISTSHIQAQEAFSKKKILKDIKAYQKAENYAKIDETLRKAFQQSADAAADAELNNYELNAQYGLMQQENRKIFLKNNPDTAQYFSRILGIYTYALRTDSLDHRPNAKGVVRPEYISNVQTKLSSTRNNLRSGGKYFYKKKKYAEAYDFFNMYLSTTSHPRISLPTDAATTSPLNTDSVEIARLAVLAAYASERYAGVVRYLPLAMTDTTLRERLLEIGAKSYEQTADTAQFMNTLRTAFQAYPQNEYFYATLIGIYDSRQDHQSSLNVINHLLNANPDNQKYWYLKGKLHHTLHQPDSAIAAFQQAIKLRPDDAEALASLGNEHLELAHTFYNTAELTLGAANYETNRRQLNSYYTAARSAYESCRKQAPDNTALWLAPLREIYFRLNLGKELKALEKIK